MTSLSPHAARGKERLTGIGLMVCAVACFACLDASAKYLNGHMATLEVVWARYTGAFLLALLVSNPITSRGVMTTRRPLLQVGRSALLLGSTILNIFALRYLQLDEALSIIFSTPFLVSVLSGPMLGERMGWRRWSAIGVGFIGVLIVTRPGFGGLHPAALLASAFCYAIYVIATRRSPVPIPTKPPCSTATWSAPPPCCRCCPSCGRNPSRS